MPARIAPDATVRDPLDEFRRGFSGAGLQHIRERGHVLTVNR
jgi:hypothetical protein